MTDAANDPTRSGAPAPAPGPGMLSLSLGEIEALGLKAAHGAGMAWGMAEEAGYAARWLAAAGQEGPRLLLGLLDLWAGKAAPGASPVLSAGTWESATGNPLCPISLGAALVDHAALPGGLERATQRTGPVAWPVLVLPFLGAVAERSGKGFVLEWTGCRLRLGQGGFHIETGVDALSRETAPALTIATCPPPEIAPRAQAPRPSSHDTVRRLDAYAMRTTVPASEASRAGAGSDRSDND